MKSLPKLTLSIVTLFGFSLVGVAEEAAGPKTPEANWQQHCKKCHGDDGSGKTRIGQRLKLRDYTDAAVQAEITDEEIVKVLAEGITDERGREVKPSYSDKLSEAEMQAMIGYIRSMAKTE